MLVAGAVFAVMFYFIDAGAVFAALVDADPVLILLVAVLLVCWNVAWGISLWYVLSTQEVGIPLGKSVLYHAAAAFSNHVTPLGQAGGEPVTAYIITKSSDTDYEVSLASVASFDALHVIPSLSFAAIGALYVLTTGTGFDNDFYVLGASVIGLAVGVPVLLYLAWRYRHAWASRVGATLNGAVRRVIGMLPGRSAPEFDVVETRLAGFAAALERVGTDRRRLALALGFSGLGWLFQALGLWVSLLALSATVPLYVPLVAVPLGATGGGLPTPGGLGGKEAVYVTSLTLLTSVDAVTIAAAVAVHATGGYLLTTTIGAGAVGVLGIDRVT